MSVDWIAVEGAYRAGVRSLRDLGKEHGISEGTIRNRAKKNGWVQDISGTKRQMVAERMAGLTQGSTQCVKRVMEEAADEDAGDMTLGLKGARTALQRSVDALELLDPDADPRNLKTLSECVKLNVETIRTIRELNAPTPDTAGSGAPVMIQIVAVGAQVRNG